MFTVAVICVISSQRALSETISIGIDTEPLFQPRFRVRPAGRGLEKSPFLRSTVRMGFFVC